MIGLFRREEESKDLLISIDPGTNTADVVPVTDVNHERVLGGTLDGAGYSIPIEDCKVYTGRKGRIFIHQAPTEIISETRRLAALEKSIVLQQITKYREKPIDDRIDVMKYVLIGILGLTLMIMAFKLGG